MNANAQIIINEAIKSDSTSLNLSGLDLNNIELPIEKLQRIRTVFINNSNLEFIPEAIYEIKDLTSLTLNNNKISSISDSIKRLKNLSRLTLEDNNFNLIPDCIFYLKNLQDLSFRKNNIQVIPVNIKNLKNLNRLFLKYNLIKDFKNACHLSSLKFLDLDNNSITKIPKEIINLTSLEILHLSNNKIKILSENLFSLKKLYDLLLDNNLLKVIPDSIGELLELGALRVSGNKLISIPNTIENLSKLRDLSADNNEFTEIPKSIFRLSSLEYLSFSRNKLSNLSDYISNLKSLKNLSLNDNKLLIIPATITDLKNLTYLQLSGNDIEKLPNDFNKLINLENLYIDNNKLNYISNEFLDLNKLKILSVKNNLIEESSLTLSRINKNNVTIDYRGNPFTEKFIYKAQFFTKIWQNVPNHLRELLKIYFNGFNTYFHQRTQQQIRLTVDNTSDGVIFELVPDYTNDPQQVEEILNDYYDILKYKLSEGAKKGVIYPTSTDDPAKLFAHIQASNFALNASQIKLSVSSHVTDQDIFIKVSESINIIEEEFHRAIQALPAMAIALQQSQQTIVGLERQKEAYQDELYYRRLEAQTRASISPTISIQQQVTIQQQAGNDFDKIRELLYSRQTEFQRDEGTEIQKELDKLNEKQLATEEKKTLSKRIKRWFENAKEAVKLGKEAGELTGEVVKHWDKFKEFAQDVLQDPGLADIIEQMKHFGE